MKIKKKQNAQKISFLAQKVKNDLSKTARISKTWTENFDFWCHLSTFGGEKSTKSRSFKVENTARILSKQLQNNF